MALRDEIRQQRAKLKGKGLKAHVQWFIEYELVITVIIAAIAVFAIVLIVAFVTNKPAAFSVMFLNAETTDTQSEETQEEFLEYAGIDGSRESVFLDLTQTLSMSSEESASDIYSTQAIVTRISGQEIDVMVTDVYHFEGYLPYGYFMDLREVLDGEILEQYEDLIYYVERSVLEADEDEDTQDGADGSAQAASGEDAAAGGEQESGAQGSEAEDDGTADGETDEGTSSLEDFDWMSIYYGTEDEALMEAVHPDNYVLPDPDGMEDPVPVGIVVNTAAYIQEYHNYDDMVCIFGALASSGHPELTQTFLEYLFENP